MKYLFIGMVIFAILALVLAASSAAVKRQSILPTPSVSIDRQVKIVLAKKEYKTGEEINFQILNNTSANIYYTPETCAGDLVHVFKVASGETPVPGRMAVCMLYPAAVTLQAYKSIPGKVNEEVLKNMAPGNYVIRFEYSTVVVKDRLVLGNMAEISSETFSVVK